MPSDSPAPNLKFGPYEVDARAGELRKQGSRIRLQEKPLRVLEALAAQPGVLITREELRKHLWPDDTFVDFETGLNTAVSKLREALNDDAEHPRYIETVPRRGYRFLAPVESGNGQDRASLHEPPPMVLFRQVSAGPVPLSGADGVAEQREESAAEQDYEVEPSVRALHARRSRGWLAASALLALIIGGAAFWLLRGWPAFSFRSRDSVLIADFENQTGDPRLDNALGTAFTVSIEQSRYANVFPRTRIDSVLTMMEKPANQRITPALGREICQRENVRGLIAASITRTGQEYALTAQLIDPQSGETVRSYTERSYGEDHILEAVDVLAKEIREALGESLYQIHEASKPLPQVTTQSLGALQQYAEGSALWRQGKYFDAGTLFKAAVAADPDFAMAHAALGDAYYSFLYNQPEDGKTEYEKALALTSRTTDRERMIIQADYALNRDHVDEADARCRAYLRSYPDDVTMRFNYANMLRRHQRQADAIEQYEQAIRTMPDFAHAYIGMATAYKSEGNYPQALQAYAKAFELDPHWLIAGNINREYGFTLVANGEDEKAEQVFTALLAKPETRENGLRSLAFLDLYRGRYASAQSRSEESLEIVRTHHSALSVARVQLLLAIIADGKGNRAEQKRQLDAALGGLKDIQEKVVFGAMLGDAYARAGYTEQAQKIAALIMPLADRNSSEQSGNADLLNGDLALLAGEHDRAIELFSQSDKENHTGLSIEALADGYQQAGKMDEAIATYEGMFGAPERALGWEPQQRWLAAYYTLATDYAARGDTQKARATLEKLLNLWKNADADLPLLKEAKAEYAKLR
ncbi:MAG: winged helix-turn-helix domain-containing protein [Candidatus Acidiferrales bacterium]